MQLGRHQHYKGDYYEVLGIALHHETLEEIVVYRGLYDHPELGHEPWFVRPKKDWLEKVLLNGQLVEHFRYVDS